MLLYIHIPFCDSKCNYCAFNSYTHLHSFKEEYKLALKKQLLFELEKHKPKIETIFIGGGTPSTLDASFYKDILSIVKPYFLNNSIEITIEANPNSASKQWLSEIFNIGINRVSFGVQSFDNEKLHFLARNHNKLQAIKAIHNAYEIGFKNINCDIIYDTVLDTKELIQKDLEIIKTLPINHISAYSLTIEEGTKFYNKSDVRIEDIDIALELFSSLKQLGFNQYEISNFAKDDNAKSKHNLGYWQYKEYLGIGCGAVGAINAQRLYTPNDLSEYINNPIKYNDIETLSKKDIKLEKILLGLRSEVGIDMDILNEENLKKIKELHKHSKIKIIGKKIYPIDYLLADEIALFIEGD